MSKDFIDKYRFVIGGGIALAIIGVVFFILKKGKKSNLFINKVIGNTLSNESNFFKAGGKNL